MWVRVLYAVKSRGFIEYSKLNDLTSRGLVVAFCLPGSDEWVGVRNKHMTENA